MADLFTHYKSLVTNDPLKQQYYFWSAAATVILMRIVEGLMYFIFELIIICNVLYFIEHHWEEFS